MKTVQMTLNLLAEVDEVVKQLGKARSAFTRTALRAAVAAIREEEKETQHQDGYKQKPVMPGEFSN